MQLTSATITTVESGDAGHGTVPCGFDAEGTAHLMRLLSDLYSNAHAAVLREYSVNAHDSHRQAGNPDPIEVTLPTDLNPTLVIADRGTGLSRDEVTNVFASYGASTKRGTNDQVGAFGLGSKSAFTLGQQFIVTAVKAGWRTVAAFGVNASGTGTVTILGHERVTEPNGVTVSISVDNPGEVQRAAGPVFSTWQPGTVLVNGQRPRSVLDDPLKVTDDICLADDPAEGTGTWGDAGLIVVMGSIGYPVSAGLRGKLVRRTRADDYQVRTLLQAQRSGQQRVFAYVGIGDVDIAPSREEMRDTPRTLARLARIIDDYRQGIAAAVNREIGSAPTLTAAARMAASLSRRPHLTQAASRHAGLAWHGKPIAHELLVPYTASVFVSSRNRCEHERGSFRLRRDDTMLDSTLVITDVPEDMEVRALRAARSFLCSQDYRRVVFAPPCAQPVGWFAFGQPDTLPAMPFPEYMAEARRRGPAPAAAGSPVRTAGYATVVGPDGGARELTADEIARLGLPVVVAGSRDGDQPGELQFSGFARAVRDGVVVVKLRGGQTHPALQRRLGPAVPVVTLAERASAVAAAVAATLSEQDRELERARACAQRVPPQAIARLTALRGRVTGPAAIALGRLHRAAHLTTAETARLDMIAAARAQEPGLFPSAAPQPGLLDQFPLLSGPTYYSLNETTRDHIVAYLNAMTG